MHYDVNLCPFYYINDSCSPVFFFLFFLQLVNQVTTRAQIPVSHVKCVQITPSALVMELCCAPAWMASTGPQQTQILLPALVSLNRYFLLPYKVV